MKDLPVVRDLSRPNGFLHAHSMLRAAHGALFRWFFGPLHTLVYSKNHDALSSMPDGSS